MKERTSVPFFTFHDSFQKGLQIYVIIFEIYKSIPTIAHNSKNPIFAMDSICNKHRGMNYIHRFLWISFCMLLLVQAGCRSDQGEQKNQGASKPMMVGAIVLVPGQLENKILATGNLMANEEVELRSEVPGRVVAINFEEGSAVKKGDLLMKIDDRELQGQLVKLQFEEKQAGDDLFRKEKLLELKAVSQEEYDKSSITLGIIKAQVDLIRTQISKTEIYAPFSGLIGLRQVSPGGFVSSSTMVARLQQTNPMKLEFAIPEKYRNKISKGALIKFRIEGYDSLFTGHIYAIDPKIDPGTRNVSIRAMSPNESGKLVPGAFAKVELVLNHLSDALVIPSESIIPQLNSEKVYISKMGKATSQIIVAGIRTENEVQVISGLKAGDTVITTGLLQLRENSPVKIRLAK